ncbi:MAG TPA: ATP citrate lyase citrate-binding domain-containing protein [Nitrospinota bacterium]|jgi:succinyl-CoA synthetase beta subunit|nr:ATP citrate lyase citrate-binding domain-containing protein [Nitrospinota bacterium]MDP7581144.1 ATP citrate lyase citrate-binding domain-containing protein [Nitrospinota bacterium]HJN02763.1 ATP citrate lyase citrate-binding domain-containing protein [Nitrospinota bacterium]
MQLTGLKFGKKLLDLVEFPVTAVLDEEASVEEIKNLIAKRGKIVIKPCFMGGIGKKGKAGLVRIVDHVSDALDAKRELFFARHRNNNQIVHANGVTFEEFIPSDVEVYFNITASTIHRRPTFTITPFGGVDIEELPEDKKKTVDFDPITGIKAFHINDTLVELGCPKNCISPLVQQLPKLWELYNNYGLTTLELNPIRMSKLGKRPIPVACDIKASFDQDNPAFKRLGFPQEIFDTEVTDFEAEINTLRTYQGQSDVVEINPKGTITPFMFGGGANSAATEILAERTSISSDFGGNPPYEKMYSIARIVYKYWLKQTSVLLVIGGKANNTDIFVTFKAIFDALKDHSAEHGVHPCYVVIGRGGPNLIKGMAYAHDTLNSMGLPYRIFAHNSSMMQTLYYALEIDKWWAKEGKKQFLKLKR